jgi:large conductance mechanosensitive channel
MGGAFGKVVSTFTEKMVAPLIGLLTGGTNFYDKKLVLRSAVEEVVDPSGKVVVSNGGEVAIEWGAFVTVVIDFIIVAFVMFLIIKALNAMKKKQETVSESAPPISNTDQLLTEIRDALKSKAD